MYPYVAGNPINLTDPTGEVAAALPLIPLAVGAAGAYAICRSLGGCRWPGEAGGNALCVLLGSCPPPSESCPPSTSAPAPPWASGAAPPDVPNTAYNKAKESDRPTKKPKPGSGKEKADDVPSWARGQRPYQGESGGDFADRLMGEKYGSNYPKGPGITG